MKRILLVDDDACVLRALRRMLRAEYDVETASGAADALVKVDTFQPNLVVSDSSMPLMTGQELLAEIRRRTPACATLLLSGSEFDSSGGFTTFRKPWNTSKLLGWIRAEPAGPTQFAA